ncbi:MAG: hypothetical protein WCK47_06895 [bacterium]|nr:hypothetical protein [Candidatus Sumerlaeota bacterium]
MTDNKNKPDDIEQTEAEPFDSGHGSPVPRILVYKDYGGAPCCSGCGCLAVALLIILLFDLGSVFSALIVAIAAAWMAGALLRLAGVSRFSPAYVYLLVPVFLALAAFLSSLTHQGKAPFGAREVVIGTLAVYAFLWLIRGGRVAS